MSYCTPCPPCDTEYPLLCEPLETTANGKRLVVEDSAACQKTIQTPVAQQVLKTDGIGNLTWTNGDNDKVLTKDSIGKIEFSQVTTNQIADSSVTTSKLADNSVTSAKIVDGTIVNADINSAAAIDGTKVNPQFGSQNIQTSGNLALIDDSSANAIISTAATAGNAIIQLRRSRGTQSAQTAVQSGDTIGQIVYYGYDGTDIAVAGDIVSGVAGTPAAGKIPINWRVNTRNDANVYRDRIFITGQNGDVGINTNSPSSKFHVEGDVSVSSATTATTVGAAGGASALPATPVGYLVVNINGTARKIPYYNV